MPDHLRQVRNIHGLAQAPGSTSLKGPGHVIVVAEVRKRDDDDRGVGGHDGLDVREAIVAARPRLNEHRISVYVRQPFDEGCE